MDIAIPTFGYQSHISTDRRHGLIRKWAVTDAAAYEGRMLRQGFLDKTNTDSAVWTDTAYRSRKKEAFLVSTERLYQPGSSQETSRRIRRANGRKSAVHPRIEHVFVEQKDRMGLFIRTIGLARARLKIGLANLVYNIKRFIWLERTAVAT